MNRKILSLIIIMGLSMVSFAPTSFGQRAVDNAKDLCPQPDLTSSQSPSDLAQIQFDIERFELCVERAELLRRLNELAQKNQDALDAFGVGGIGTNTLETIPAPLPVSGQNPSIGVDLDSFSASRGQVATAPEPEEPVEEVFPWTIGQIYGVTGRLLAQIANVDGETITVRKGDVTPDEYTVIEISKSGIVLNQGDESVGLRWAR